MRNQLGTNFSHSHYFNFDTEKLFLKIFLITNKKWVELTRKVSYVQGE